jgi:hypothetical protein
MKEFTLRACHHNEAVFKANFVRHLPNRFDLAIELDLDEDTKSCCHAMDCIEYHYRRYVSGQSGDMRRVFFEIRQFLCNGYLPQAVAIMIDDVKDLVIKEEFYELMPRIDSSSVKISRLISNHNLIH